MGGKLNVMSIIIKQPVWRHNSNGRKFVIFIKHWVKAQIENLRSKISCPFVKYFCGQSLI